MADESKYPTRIAPYGLRMPPELKARIEAAARSNGRSLHQELIATLESAYPETGVFDLLVAEIQRLKSLMTEVPDDQREMIEHVADQLRAQFFGKVRDAGLMVPFHRSSTEGLERSIESAIEQDPMLKPELTSGAFGPLKPDAAETLARATGMTVAAAERLLKAGRVDSDPLVEQPNSLAGAAPQMRRRVSKEELIEGMTGRKAGDGNDLPIFHEDSPRFAGGGGSADDTSDGGKRRLRDWSKMNYRHKLPGGDQ